MRDRQVKYLVVIDSYLNDEDKKTISIVTAGDWKFVNIDKANSRQIINTHLSTEGNQVIFYGRIHAHVQAIYKKEFPYQVWALRKDGKLI